MFKIRNNRHLNTNRQRTKNYLWRMSFKIFPLLFLVLAVLQNKSYAQQLAQGKDKFLGAATSYYYWRNFSDYWNQITPGNDGKWGSVENVKGQYSWTNLDAIYNFARARNLIFKEHALVWGQQAPSWIASLDSASQRTSVENWMKAFGARYPLTAMVDVVNEPFHAVPSFAKGLGGNGQTGWDWVIKSFELARQYMPVGCKLILNEYNVLHDNTVTTNYLNLIKLLSDRNLIDGIGVQGHYFEFRSHIDATSGTYVWSVNTIKSNLDRLAATGLPIYITEFDIDEQVNANQLASYKIYFPIFWAHPAVKGITLWGYINTDVWTSHPYTYLIIENGPVERPALTWLRDYITNPTDIKIENENLPAEFSLNQNYPNPFNPTTIISFSVPDQSNLRLDILDVLGREVINIANGNFNAGNHKIQLDASGLSSGVYFCRLKAGKFISTKKLVLIR